MAMVKRVLGAYLVVTGIAAVALLILTPLIHDGSPDYPIWKILNWFMAAGVLVILFMGFRGKRSRGADEPDVVERLRLSLVYYGSIVLTMLFFWGFLWTLNPESETGGAVTSHLVYFPLVDALYTTLALSIGRRLWREAGGSAS